MVGALDSADEFVVSMLGLVSLHDACACFFANIKKRKKFKKTCIETQSETDPLKRNI